jgi:hypothetical protein
LRRNERCTFWSFDVGDGYGVCIRHRNIASFENKFQNIVDYFLILLILNFFISLSIIHVT